MITLGIFGEAETLEGEVKLEQGDKIQLTRSDVNNSIIIEALVKDIADLDDVAGVPADGEVLTWNAAAGLWLPAVAGGAGFWTIVEEKTIPGSIHTATFATIPVTAKHLRLIIIARTNNTTFITMQLNLDGGNNYNYHRAILSGAYSRTIAVGTFFWAVWQVNNFTIYPMIIDISQLFAGYYKGFKSHSVSDDTTWMGSGSWYNNASLITRIDVFAGMPGGADTWELGSRLTLLAR